MRKISAKANKAKHSVSRPSGILAGSARGAGFGFLAAVTLLLVFAVAVNGTNDPNAFVKPLSLAALYLGGLIAGVAAVRFSRDGIAAGLLAGVIYSAAVLLFSLFPLPDSGFPFSASVILLLLILPASVLGSIAGRRREKRPVRR